MRKLMHVARTTDLVPGDILREGDDLAGVEVVSVEDLELIPDWVNLRYADQGYSRPLLKTVPIGRSWQVWRREGAEQARSEPRRSRERARRAVRR